MDEKSHGYNLQAPAAASSSSSWRLPEDDWPRVDDYLETTDAATLARRAAVVGSAEEMVEEG